MAVEEQIQRLFLSAEEIKQLTNWPYEMVEDYLNILRDLVLLASNIDINVDQLSAIESNIAALYMDAGANETEIRTNAQNIARSEMLLSSLSLQVSTLEVAIEENTNKIKNIEQLAVII